ncbi:MAG: hydantoinase/oxoprolinase family protein [Parvularculaceae bacterium]
MKTWPPPRAHAIERGEDVAARVMIAFGGAAPLHAARLAEKLAISEIIIPADAGVGSAVGFLLAPAAFEVVRSRPMRLDAFDAAAVSSLIDEMHEEAAVVLKAAAGDAPLTETLQAYMRYRGQGHEISVAIDRSMIEPTGESCAPRSRPHTVKLYGRTIPDMEIEALTWSLTLAGPRPGEQRSAGKPTARRVASDEKRTVFDATAGREMHYALHERTALSPGDLLDGPALIVEDQTTTVVTSAFDARIDARGNIILERKSA